MSREPPCVDPDDPVGVFPGPSDGATRHAPERWRETVSAEAVAHLRREGWCVIDGFLSGAGGDERVDADEAGGEAGVGSETAGFHVDKSSEDAWASALRDEIRWLSRVGLVQPNRTHFANHAGERYLFSKPHVFEADMHDANVRRRVPALARFFEDAAAALPDAFAEADTRAETSQTSQTSTRPKFPPLSLLARGDAARTVKLQHNEGFGGCFPCHYDNPGGTSRRLLTCILYLNPGWAEGDGGELVLTPFLSRRVRVRPKHDRLAVFYSDRVCHSVEPARAERFCLTVWLDGVAGSVNTSEDTQLSLPASVLTDPDAVAETLRLSAAQRSLSRAVYAEAYRESLTRCMAGAAGCDEMLASHDAAVEATRGNMPLAALVEALRERKAFAEMGGDMEV